MTRWFARLDAVSLTLNLVFLAGVSFLPFAAALLSRFSPNPAALLVYFCTAAIMPSALLLQWLWTRHRRLLVSDLTAENAAVILRRQVIAVLVFAVATAWAAVTLLRH